MSKYDSVNIIALFHNFYRYRLSVIIIFITVLLATFFYVKKIVPIYSSNILISIQGDKTSSISLFQNSQIVNVDMEGKLEYDTKILKSRHIISRVLKKIDFSKRFFIDNGWRDRELYSQEIPFKVDFSTSDKSRAYKFTIKIVNKNSFALKELRTGVNKIYSYGEKIKTETCSLIIYKKLEPKQNQEYKAIFTNNREKLIKNILDNLSIEKHANKLLKISYEDRVPIRAKDVISQLVNSYKEYNLNSRQRNDVNHITFLDKTIIELGSSLKVISDKIKDYRTEHSELLTKDAEKEIFSNIIKKDHSLTELYLKLNALKITKSRFKQGLYTFLILENSGIKIEALKQSISKLKRENEQLYLLQKQKSSLENLVIKNLFYSNLLSQLKKEKIELIKLLTDYTYEYPKVKRVNRKIELLKTEMRGYINNSITVHSTEIKALKKEINKTLKMLIDTVKKEYHFTKKSLKKYRKTIHSIPKSTIRLEELKRAFELNENNYKKLLQKRSEALISKESTMSNIQIVDSAIEPIKPIKPKKAFLYLASIILALFIAILYTSIRTFRDKKFYNESSHILKDYSVIYDKTQNIKDMIWVLISQLKESIDSKKAQIVLVTSSNYREDKSTIIKELSLALREISKKVLIIDFDLHNPQISNNLSSVSEIGLSTILTSKHELEEIEISDYINYINTGYKNIDILRSGPIVPNSSSLLFNPKIKPMLKNLSQKYDYILIDSTPIGINPTVNVLFEYIDRLLIVAEMEKTEKTIFQKINEFKRDNMKISVFLTNSKQKRENEKHN